MSLTPRTALSSLLGRRVLLLAVFWWFAAGAFADGFQIVLTDDAVYRVTFAELQAAGLSGEIPSAELGLSRAGRPVPIHLEDGRDGRFGAGDSFVFVGNRLPSDHGGANDVSALNVYRLQTDAIAPARILDRPPAGEPVCRGGTIRTTKRFEQDLFRIGLSIQPTYSQEVWLWRKLTHADPQEFTLPLELPELAPTKSTPATLRVRVRGWSRLPLTDAGNATDHRLEAWLDGALLGGLDWNTGDRGQLLEVDIPHAALRDGEGRLTLKVPPRRREGSDEPPIIDAVMLDWIEVDYSRARRLQSAQAIVEIGEKIPGACAVLETREGRSLEVYSEDGTRVVASSPSERGGSAIDLARRFPANVPLHAVRDAGYRKPVAVVVDRPAGLGDPDRQADYVIIAHGSLLEAVEPLAQLHRQRGLIVTVVDVGDVYDEFNDGVAHPQAIQDFLRHAHEFWRRPAPRFVLLVGDASWGQVSVDQQVATRFPSVLPNRSGAGSFRHRGLVPTFGRANRSGNIASDNRFACIDDDEKPDLAIGRLPVVDPAELDAIVEKIRRYLDPQTIGPWRRRILWITPEQDASTSSSEVVTRSLAERGFVTDTVDPGTTGKTDDHRQTLMGAFNEGSLLVHFLGHGGRYVWRTGPADLANQSELFTMDHLDQLQPAAGLPVVLSLTCYAAPFDHPTAESMGERFLTLPDRGAIAVIAAASRNSPTIRMSALLIEELTRPGTVGEALMRAKRRSVHPEFTEQYNLLGDPALPLSLPGATFDVALIPGEVPSVRADIEGALLDGQARIDWLDERGAILHSAERALGGRVLNERFDGDAARVGEIAGVAVYVWNAAAGIDGVGAAGVR